MNIWDAISHDLNIDVAPWEDAAAFHGRILRSAAAAWILVLIHQKEKVDQQSLLCMVSQKLLALETDETLVRRIVGEALRVLMENGELLVTSERFLPSPRKVLGFRNVVLLRGPLPWDHPFYSGFCPYLNADSGAQPWMEAMGLLSMDMDDILPLLWDRSIPADPIAFGMEYLTCNNSGIWFYAMQRPAWQDYLLGGSRDLTGQYTQYIFYNNEMRRIPDEVVRTHLPSYARMALMKKHAPPSVIVQRSPALTRLRLQVELPGNEQRVLRLISWPDPSGDTHVSSITSALAPEVLRHLQTLGFQITETTP